MNWYDDLHEGGFNGVSAINRNPVTGQMFQSHCAHCGMNAYYQDFQDPSFHECARLLQERDAYFVFMAGQAEKEEAYKANCWTI